MWQLLFSGVSSIFKAWIDKKKSQQEAEAAYNRQALSGEQDWDLEAMRQARYSIKDELITIIWFTPLVVAWFYPDEAQKWLDFVSNMPMWYQVGMFGIMAASFGLRWYFKQQAFKVGKG